MIPLLALASLLAGATYFGLPDWDEDGDDSGAADEHDSDAPGGSLLDDAGGSAPAPPLLQSGGDSDAGMAAFPQQPDGPGPDMDDPGTTPPEQENASPEAPALPDAAAQDDYGTFRTLDGTAGDDTLRAGFGDTLSGGDGDDALMGHRGDDHLIGGDGDDLLRAGAGNNLLEGGDGSDLLIGVESHADMATGLETMLTPPGGPSLDILDGGDGDDVLRMGHGDVGIGGQGSDLFEVQAEAPEDDALLPVIEDFDPEHDRLVLAVPFTVEQIAAAWPNTPEHEATVTVQDFEDGTGATIYVDGEAVARVTGAQGLDPALIRLTGSDLIGPDYAQLEAAQTPTSLWQGMTG